jgi:hypothetical protein
MSTDADPQRSRRQAFALAAVLALTVVTGGAAVTGLRQKPAQPPRAAQIVQVAPAPAAAAHFEGDD